jgi:hypothetical protein
VKNIKNTIWRFLRNRFLRTYVRIIQRVDKKENLSEKQINSVRIMKRMIVSSESEIVISPSTGVFYITWRDIFLKFYGERVQIINGKYFYEVSLSFNQQQDVQRFYRQHMEKKIVKIEKSVVERTNRSFNNILSEIEEAEKIRTK